MHSVKFNAYKARYGAVIQQVLSDAEPGRLDEFGFPAYSHVNPFINWLFWKRLHTVMSYIEGGAPYARAMDFGCGSGVMLPFLAEICGEVLAADIDLLPLQHMQKHLSLAPNVQMHDASPEAMATLPQASFDLILALDVLEHVQDLSGTIALLLPLLRPGGQVVISGPTENALYRLGRRLAGPEFSGDYHERGIAEIRREFSKRATVKNVATLYSLAPLFEIFAVVR